MMARIADVSTVDTKLRHGMLRLRGPCRRGYRLGSNLRVRRPVEKSPELQRDTSGHIAKGAY